MFHCSFGRLYGSNVFSLHILIETEPLRINNCFFLRRPPPLCSSSSSCSLEISSKDPRVSGNRTDLFFTLKQRGDWERHSVRTCCSSVEKDLLLMHTHPHLSTLLFETEYLRLWETHWPWIVVFSCDCHLGATEPSPMGRGLQGYCSSTHLCKLQEGAIAGEADEILTDAPSRQMNFKRHRI